MSSFLRANIQLVCSMCHLETLFLKGYFYNIMDTFGLTLGDGMYLDLQFYMLPSSLLALFYLLLRCLLSPIFCLLLQFARI